MVIATVGYSMAPRAFALGPRPSPLEGSRLARISVNLEPLVRFMQETPADKLVPRAGRQSSKAGADLEAPGCGRRRSPTPATFGGEDLCRLFTPLMALAPAAPHVAANFPMRLQPLPVFQKCSIGIRIGFQGAGRGAKGRGSTPSLKTRGTAGRRLRWRIRP